MTIILIKSDGTEVPLLYAENVKVCPECGEEHEEKGNLCAECNYEAMLNAIQYGG